MLELDFGSELMPSAALITFFEAISLLGSVLVVLKLYKTGLYRRYRTFFWYFVVRIFLNIGHLLIHDTSTRAYLHFWAYTTPIAWIFYVLVVFELYRLVLERYKGLYTLGMWVMYISLVISIGISFVSLLLSPSAKQLTGILQTYYPMERGINFALMIFILLILIFLTQYHAPLSRNVVVYAVLYSVYFLSNTLVFLMRSVFGLRSAALLNVILTGISATCVLAWFFLLTSKGEEVSVQESGIGPRHEERIVQQLEALNTTLLKASRK